MNKRQHDIERYLKGEMTPSEMHALEREALQDPFLSEALEGIDQAGKDSFLFDLKELNHTIHQRTRARKPKLISMWNWSIGIAAGLILVAISGVYVIRVILQNDAAKQLAQVEQSKKESNDTVSADSVSTASDSDRLLSLNTSPKSAPEKSSSSRKSNTTPAIDDSRHLTTAPVQNEVREEPTEKADQAIAEAAEAPAIQAEKDNAAERQRTSLAEKSEANVKRDVASSRIVRGKVTSSEDGVALPGVNVLVKGKSAGAVTDDEGNYEIALEDGDKTLTFAFIGMKSVETDVSEKQEMNVKLFPDYSQLSEVVVTGYGESQNNAQPSTLELAEPEGGRKAFQKYLEEKMSYPTQALENKVEGRVTVQFTVEPNGELKDFKIIKGIGFGCDDEVIRLIKEGPAWVPTKRNAQPVGDKVKVRLKFDMPK